MDLAEQAVSKAQRRLMPFLCLLYFISYIDRSNIAFASLSMNKALGLSGTQYGFAAGLFFLGYIVVEIPSNLIQTKVGARLWIPRIMISWGLVTVATAWVTGANGFYAMRVLLGVAEGGFFPGMVYYMTLWFPRAYRGRVIGLFMLASPLSGFLGGPIASLIFSRFDGALGFASWQWLFILEGIPAVLLGFACWWFLPDRPATAKWLTPGQRDALEARLAREAEEVHAVRRMNVLQSMGNPRVLLLAFLMFCAQGVGYGLGFWMPQIIKGLGVTDVTVGLLTMLPYGIGILSMLFWTQLADRSSDRAIPLTLALCIATVGFVAIGLARGDATLTILAIAFTLLGQATLTPLLWSLPTTFLTGVGSAGALALISSIGASAGFFGPTLIGWSRDLTGGFSASMFCIAGAVALAAVLVFSFCRNLSVDAKLPAAARR